MALALLLVSWSCGLLAFSAVPAMGAPTSTGSLFLTFAPSMQTGICGAELDPSSPTTSSFAGEVASAKSPAPSSNTFAFTGFWSPNEQPYCMQAAYPGRTVHTSYVTFTLNLAAFAQPIIVGFALYDLHTLTHPPSTATPIAERTSATIPASPGSTCASPVHLTFTVRTLGENSKTIASGDTLAADVSIGLSPIGSTGIGYATVCYGSSGSQTASSVTIAAS